MTFSEFYLLPLVHHLPRTNDMFKVGAYFCSEFPALLGSLDLLRQLEEERERESRSASEPSAHRLDHCRDCNGAADRSGRFRTCFEQRKAPNTVCCALLATADKRTSGLCSTLADESAYQAFEANHGIVVRQRPAQRSPTQRSVVTASRRAERREK